MLGLTAVVAACTSPMAPSGASLLRVTNAGPVPIQSLVVQFPDESIDFGDVPAGATTRYHAVSRGVYEYAAYRYRLHGEASVQPVIDWVGEEPIDGSAFTYVIEFDPDRPSFQHILLVRIETP